MIWDEQLGLLQSRDCTTARALLKTSTCTVQSVRTVQKNGAAEVLWSRSPRTQMADEEEGEGCLHNLSNYDSQKKAESHHSVEGRFVCVYLTWNSVFGILGCCFAKIWEETRGSGPPLKLMTFYNRSPTMKTRL